MSIALLNIRKNMIMRQRYGPKIQRNKQDLYH